MHERRSATDVGTDWAEHDAWGALVPEASSHQAALAWMMNASAVVHAQSASARSAERKARGEVAEMAAAVAQANAKAASAEQRAQRAEAKAEAAVQMTQQAAELLSNLLARTGVVESAGRRSLIDEVLGPLDDEDGSLASSGTYLATLTFDEE
jgi:hypothetical protein